MPEDKAELDESSQVPDSRAGAVPPPLPRVASGHPNRAEFVVRPGDRGRIGLFASDKSPRHGEEGVIEVCTRLIKHLSQHGITWNDLRLPHGHEEGVDCICDDPQGVVKLQVTRAVRDTEFFSILSEHKAVTTYTTDPELANALWESIEHKANRTPVADRGSIVLVLDSSEIFFVKNSTSLRLFATTFGERAKALGFREIWLVGPHELFVEQLA